MSDKKISELTNITGANLADADEFVVVDTSASETKAITRSELASGLVTASTVTSAGALMDSELTDITAVKALNQGVATTDDPTFTNTQLAAIAASKAVTAVDVFVYDTSKDSDGGAWRNRTQHTSWYNETLNTATRGGRREFPAVAVIVAVASDGIKIYDGDDPSLPLWMEFETGSVASWGVMNLMSHGTFSSVAMLNGRLSVGMTSTDGCVNVADFINDTGYKHHSTISYGGPYKGNIAERNSGKGYAGPQTGVNPANIVNGVVNDVAMTVLPDAPIDPATGLQVPTIAVATAGGVSVIRDDGTVVSGGELNSGWTVTGLFFDGDATLWATEGTAYSGLQRMSVPPFSSVTSIGDPINGGYGYPYYNPVTANTYGAPQNAPKLRQGGVLYGKAMSAFGNTLVAGNSAGISKVLHNSASQLTSLVNFTTSTYNTGWMNGNIKGAFLADTDDTDLVGSTVVSEDFTSGLGGFTAFNGFAVLSNVSGRLRVASNDASEYGRAVRSFSTTVGETYVVQMENFSGGGGVVFYVGSSSGGSQYGLRSGPGVKTVTFKATATTAYITCYNDGVPSTNYAEYDNLTVKLADADRSVNNNGLIVNGTITRSPVATGAELVAYSGFSASNYLEQPYNSDLDFGTGDFCVMGWVNGTKSGQIFDRFDAAETGARFSIVLSGSYTRFFTSSGFFDASALSAGPAFVVMLRKSGVLYGYINGLLVGSVASTGSLTNTSANLRVGTRANTSSSPLLGSLALLRISATAPTAEQIKKIYEDEKVLFQDNAACTLYGTSDAVTALAHDEDTGLLHVGTSAGRSVFQGLRRVSNTTTAVGTAISASNGLVVEE